MKYHNVCRNCNQNYYGNGKIYCSSDCQFKFQVGKHNPNYRPAKPRQCGHCRLDFFSHTPSRKYCSFACYAQTVKGKPKKRKFCIIPMKAVPLCKCCQTNYTPARNRVLCETCKTKNHICAKSEFKDCPLCGKAYKRKAKQAFTKYCSPKCHRKAQGVRQTGEKSHFWAGGKTAETSKIRNSSDYKEWRTNVFVRDDFTCQMCQQKGGKLTAHHILEFAKYPSCRLVLWNGITLCRNCHHSIHFKEAAMAKTFLRITAEKKHDINKSFEQASLF